MRIIVRWTIITSMLMLLGCVMVEKTYDQSLYDACVDEHNKQFRYKPAYRAMVAGAGYGSTRCYWVWSRGSLQQARNDAIENCRKQKGYCTVFSDSNGLAPWASRISHNGGRDPGGSPSLGSHGDFVSNQSPVAPPARQPATNRPPRRTGGGAAYTCFDLEQNRIAAQFSPRVAAASGICLQSTVSRDMWQAIVDAASHCGMPADAISTFRQNVESSKRSMNNSCVR